ncbi:MAG: DUF1667 domain-containing protein [Treponema sp.]|nr:DUF1667 domain-containing protein [Treponema sp.]MCL2237457.1 DUF1667 domain-containing protein [Treponema sp.]
MKNGKRLFSGNGCGKGAQVAKRELSAPFRSLTTMVRTIYPDMPVLSVRTNGEIPKKKVKKIVKKLSRIVVTERKAVGEIVMENISKTGCDVVAAGDMKERLVYCRP